MNEFLQRVQDEFVRNGTHVVSIRPGKKGGWIMNFRVSEMAWQKPLDREFPTIEAGFRAFFRIEEERSQDDLGGLLG